MQYKVIIKCLEGEHRIKIRRKVLGLLGRSLPKDLETFGLGPVCCQIAVALGLYFVSHDETLIFMTKGVAEAIGQLPPAQGIDLALDFKE